MWEDVPAQISALGWLLVVVVTAEFGELVVVKDVVVVAVVVVVNVEEDTLVEVSETVVVTGSFVEAEWVVAVTGIDVDVFPESKLQKKVQLKYVWLVNVNCIAGQN